jgi:hypothetical protein
VRRAGHRRGLRFGNFPGSGTGAAVAATVGSSSNSPQPWAVGAAGAANWAQARARHFEAPAAVATAWHSRPCPHFLRSRARAACRAGRPA